MGKKKKLKENTARAAATPTTAPVRPKVGEGEPLTPWIRDIPRNPTLALGWVFLAITLFAIAMALHFRDNPDLGAMSEPTAIFIWSGITATFFASYYRQTHPSKKSDS